MAKKIAYLMHIDWNWIKQRPHFLAEKLTDFYDIDLFFVRKYNTQRKTLNTNNGKFKSVNIIRKIPYSAKSPLLMNFEKIINTKIINKIYMEEYDVIWITSPVMLQFVDLQKVRASTIIYDCMDDVLAFPQSKKIKKYLMIQEKSLLNEADLVFASSKELESRITKRGHSKEIFIINNGIQEEDLIIDDNEQNNVKSSDDLFNIVYFGTISKWFDFELILELLELHDDIKFTLVGIKEVSIPKHERITYYGIVKHEELKLIAQEADAFIMPFKLNDLVLAVDPVKVYEYIAFMKPVIAVRYVETMKFREFVYLYNDINDINKLLESRENLLFRKSKHEVRQFIEKNSWNSIVIKINELLG